MASVAELIIKIIGKDDASKTIDGVGSKLQTALKVGTGAVVAGAGVAGGALLKMGSDWDSAIDTIAIGTGASGADLEALGGDMKAVLTSIPADADSAAQAIADMNTMTGATGDTLQGLAKNALELSRITDSDLGTTISETTQAFNNWGLSADEQAGALDKLFVASQATGVPVEELAASIAKGGPALRDMGLGLDESIALLANLDKAGVDSTQVLSGLNRAVADAAKEGKPASEAVGSLFDSIANAESDTEATRLAVEAFGNRAGPALADSIRSGATSVDDLTAVIANSEGAILDTAAATNDWGEKFQIMKNKAFVALEPISSKVFETFGAFGQVGPMIAGIAPLVGKIGPAFALMSAQALPALQGIGLALLTPPLGIIIAIGAVLALAWVFRDEIIGVFQAIWSVVGPILTQLGGAITGAFQGALDWVTENWDAIGGLISGPFEAIKDAAGGIFGVKDAVTGAVQGMLDFGKEHWPEIATILSGPFAPLVALATDAFGIRSAVEGAFTGMLDKARQWGTDIATFFQGVPGALKTAFGAGFDFLWQAFRSAVNSIIRAWNGLSFGIPGFDPPGPGPKFPGVTINTPDIPLLAGGLFEVPGPSGAGDVFPAMLSPGEMVVPAGQAEKIRQGLGGGGGLTLNIQGDVNVHQTREARSPRQTLEDVAFASAAALRARGVMVTA